jgi:c-di-GMP-related signal transduction protein
MKESGFNELADKEFFIVGMFSIVGELLSVEESKDRWEDWNLCPSNGLE